MWRSMMITLIFPHLSWGFFIIFWWLLLISLIWKKKKSCWQIVLLRSSASQKLIFFIAKFTVFHPGISKENLIVTPTPFLVKHIFHVNIQVFIPITKSYRLIKGAFAFYKCFIFFFQSKMVRIKYLQKVIW